MEKLTQDMLDKMVMEELQSSDTGPGKRPGALEKLMEQAQLKRTQATETVEAG